MCYYTGNLTLIYLYCNVLLYWKPNTYMSVLQCVTKLELFIYPCKCQDVCLYTYNLSGMMLAQCWVDVEFSIKHPGLNIICLAGVWYDIQTHCLPKKTIAGANIWDTSC